MRRQKPLYYYAFIFLATIAYGFIAYVINRWETHYLIPVYGFLFLMYAWVIKKAQPEQVVFWVAVSFFFRFIFLFSLPSLSDDFYRFIWDGRLWSEGYHPFAQLPSVYVQQGIIGVDQTLFQKLNSPGYFTIYPPVSQFIFWLSVKISPQSVLGSVIFMRSVLLVAEAGSVVIMLKLTKRFQLPATNSLIYALNPLVIIELTGNLHFEALVISFVLLATCLIVNNRWLISAVSLSMAIGAKLLPLIFLPALFATLGIKRFIKYGVVVICLLVVFFFPLFDQHVLASMSESLSLYFTKFEFNASIYYLVREYGFWKYGYNIIQTAGWKLGLIAAILILLLSFRRGISWYFRPELLSLKALLTDWMWMLCIYFLFTTTLHPWYITTLLALSVFSTFRFPVIWTGLIFLTYAGYSKISFQENLWLTALEYGVVIGYMFFELKTKANFKIPFIK